MITYAIAIQRGGAGKTTTALTLGAYLHRKGQRVLFIDLDAQCSLSMSLGINPITLSSFEVLTKTCTLEDAICKCDYGEVVHGSLNLVTSDSVLNEVGKEYRLREALETVKDKYDAVIIDTPPGLGILTINALTSADVLIIPAQPEIYSVEGLALLNHSIESVRKYTNPNLIIGGILITRYNARTNFSKSIVELLEKYASEIGTKVYKSKIRECVAVKESQAFHESIFDYDKKSNATEDYEAFIKELLRDIRRLDR